MCAPVTLEAVSPSDFLDPHRANKGSLLLLLTFQARSSTLDVGFRAE